MLKSDSRILTTHFDAPELELAVERAVQYVVGKQLEAGIDIGNDGEQPRVGFQTYVPQRMRGFGGESKRPIPQDMREFPDYERLLAESVVWAKLKALSEGARRATERLG